MTNEQRNSWPLPEMPDEPCASQGLRTAGEAGVVGAPPHDPLIVIKVEGDQPLTVIGESVRQEWWTDGRQVRYHEHRRAHAEAIGRPYPDERHAVWPR